MIMKIWKFLLGIFLIKQEIKIIMKLTKKLVEENILKFLQE